jgi:hypothetical protein
MAHINLEFSLFSLHVNTIGPVAITISNSGSIDWHWRGARWWLHILFKLDSYIIRRRKSQRLNPHLCCTFGRGVAFTIIATAIRMSGGAR